LRFAIEKSWDKIAEEFLSEEESEDDESNDWTQRYFQQRN
jgi:hypothetical protein